MVSITHILSVSLRYHLITGFLAPQIHSIWTVSVKNYEKQEKLKATPKMN
jgi:hypothetical protein